MVVSVAYSWRDDITGLIVGEHEFSTEDSSVETDSDWGVKMLVM